MLDRRKLIGLAVAIAVIAIVVIAVDYQAKQKQIIKQIPDVGVFDPQNPNFLRGEVVSSQIGVVVFTSGGNTYTAKTSVSTKVVRQVKSGNTITTVDGLLSDVKPKNTIVVLFSSPLEDKNLVADKIQIVTQ